MAATTPLTPAHLTTPQIESLVVLGMHGDQGTTPGSVARRRGMSRTMASNVARTLDRLVEMGLAADVGSLSVVAPQPRYRITGAGLSLLEQVTPAESGVFSSAALRSVLGLS